MERKIKQCVDRKICAAVKLGELARQDAPSVKRVVMAYLRSVGVIK